MSYLFLIDNPNTEIFLSDKNVVQIYSRSLRQGLSNLNPRQRVWIRKFFVFRHKIAAFYCGYM
nr:MAG TPA: hypothetical protein [Caudoviricetes sp.]